MNLLDLLQVAGNQAQPQPQAAPAAAPVTPSLATPAPTLPTTAPPEQGPDMQVKAGPTSQYKDKGLWESLFGHSFAPGHTMGNILGHIGDALLVQGGAQPQYAPMLHRLRLSEALQHFDTEPDDAIARASQVDPVFAAKLREQHTDDVRQQQSVDTLGEYRKALADQQAQAAKDRADALRDKNLELWRKGAYGLLYSAKDPKTYQAIKPRLNEFAKARGTSVAELFGGDLPDQYDPVTIDALRNGGMTPAQQATVAEERRFHDATVGRQTNNDTQDNAVAKDNLTARQKEIINTEAYRKAYLAHLKAMEAKKPGSVAQQLQLP